MAELYDLTLENDNIIYIATAAERIFWIESHNAEFEKESQNANPAIRDSVNNFRASMIDYIKTHPIDTTDTAPDMIIVDMEDLCMKIIECSARGDLDGVKECRAILNEKINELKQTSFYQSRGTDRTAENNSGSNNEELIELLQKFSDELDNIV